MTVASQDELDGLREVGQIVANAMLAMARTMQPGMITRELDEFGRRLLDREGAVPTPQAILAFPARPASA